MWRIFRWLDRHEPGLYKFTVMVFGLGAVVGAGFLLARTHPAAGILFALGVVYALMWASMTYRFNMKPTETPQREQAISQASEQEVLRRVRRHAKTEFWRRKILSLRDTPGREGDLARAIIKRWEEAGTPDGRPVPKDEEKGK